MAVHSNLCHRQNRSLLIQEALLLLLFRSSPVAGAGAAAAAPYRLACECLEVNYVLSPCDALGHTALEAGSAINSPYNSELVLCNGPSGPLQ